MRFQPKTKEELETMDLLSPGIYQCKVLTAKDKTSKSGNEMIELQLEVYNNDGPNRNIFDYLLEAMPKKLFSFCDATGMGHHYSEGTLRSHDCEGKSAYIEVAIQKGKENPQGGMYSDKNEVKKYMTKDEAGAKPVASKTKPMSTIPFDEEIPF